MADWAANVPIKMSAVQKTIFMLLKLCSYSPLCWVDVPWTSYEKVLLVTSPCISASPLPMGRDEADTQFRIYSYGGKSVKVNQAAFFLSFFKKLSLFLIQFHFNARVSSSILYIPHLTRGGISGQKGEYLHKIFWNSAWDWELIFHLLIFCTMTMMIMWLFKYQSGLKNNTRCSCTYMTLMNWRQSFLVFL